MSVDRYMLGDGVFEKLILEPIRRNCDLYFESPSFCIQNKLYPYKTFCDRISAIRREVSLLAQAGQIIGLVIHDDIDTYASIFALWMEGKSYVPIHPLQPIDRNREIISQVGIKVLLDSCPDAVFAGTDVVCTSECQCEEMFLDRWAETSPDELAYILFTSGSTGKPKGVQITRRNIGSFMEAFWKTGITITENDRCLQCFDLTFDVSVQSFLVALTRGACVYTVPYGKVKYLYSASLINDQHITFGAMAPSMLTYLKPYFDQLDFSSLRQCILTAEACPVSLMEDLFEVAPNVEIYDFYGPTEGTIYSTYYKLHRNKTNKSLNGVISIGKPLSGFSAQILMEDGRRGDVGEKGELIISGEQLSPGYWDNEEKNSAAFFMRDNRRYYHTGDLCYIDADGDIMYSGRIDQQAKIQGFRVELGEIEHHTRCFYSNETRAVAIAFDNEAGLTEIALFVESASEDTAALKRYLQSKMPAYMIPTRYLFMDSFPLNKSEKVDRVALKKKITNE